MKIIDNRYKISEKIESTTLYDVYRVFDTHRNSEERNLKVYTRPLKKNLSDFF